MEPVLFRLEPEPAPAPKFFPPAPAPAPACRPKLAFSRIRQRIKFFYILVYFILLIMSSITSLSYLLVDTDSYQNNIK